MNIYLIDTFKTHFSVLVLDLRVGNDILNKKVVESALAGVAQWIKRQPASQRVTSLVPSQDTCLGQCLGCRTGPQLGNVREATDQCFFHTLMFLSLSFPPFPSL